MEKLYFHTKEKIVSNDIDIVTWKRVPSILIQSNEGVCSERQ